MIYVLTTVHVIVSVILILVVLLQTGKRADLAGAFGGGGSQTAFGARGAATVLSKATTVAAVLFMLTSLGLSIMSSRSGGTSRTVLDESPAQSAPAPTTPAPAVPEPTTPAPADSAPADTAPATTDTEQPQPE